MPEKKLLKDQLPPDLAAKLVPGDGNPEGSAPKDWKPCGKADAIVFLGDIEGLKEDKQTIGILYPGFERRAKCYMAPPLENPEAKLWAETHGHQEGYAIPDISALLMQYPEIYAAAQKAGRPIERLFAASQAGINANQLPHILRWQIFQVEEGIWAVLYVEQK